MRELKNIDRLYQENLKDFEVFPPNKSWDRIEKRLGAEKLKRRVPIWVKMGSVAALFVLLFSVGTVYFLPDSNAAKNILSRISSPVDSEDGATKTVDELIPNKVILANTEVVEQIENSSNSIDESSQFNLSNNTEELNKDQLESIPAKKGSLLADAVNLPFEESDETEKAKKSIINSKLSFATIFAPIYLNSFNGGSGIDSQYKDNPGSGNSSYSYGVKVAYQLNNKFSVQSGVNLITLGYRTNNVYVTPGVAVLSFSNVSSNPLVGKQGTTTKEGAISTINENVGSLNQLFGYVEIPVELKYSVTDGKLGVNLVGGFSTLLLNRDEVFIKTNEFSQSLGASNNLRSVNFSGNIGVDVDYFFNKNLFINVSPMLKVQTNTFSKNSGSFQPYYLGVYTGLNYKF